MISRDTPRRQVNCLRPKGEPVIQDKHLKFTGNVLCHTLEHCLHCLFGLKKTIMEVHHHTQRSGKKWHHHLWEFLMLFLAVFCGFLAEYYLEQTIEHHREKQFMRSLVEDLILDTTELKQRILQADDTRKYSDSAISFLNSYKPSIEYPNDQKIEFLQRHLHFLFYKKAFRSP